MATFTGMNNLKTQTDELFCLDCSNSSTKSTDSVGSISSSSRDHRLKPCCGQIADSFSESMEMDIFSVRHEDQVLPCGHIGCNYYRGNCIVCDKEAESKEEWGKMLTQFAKGNRYAARR
ncbi:expressed unknown protein [Seminavis robusta]|uniref:Uncharacterized protein n=1 Tax=Seminavis robusta TaxID=568900 RepID=A0A9N8HEP7_9STRA|nr:expressed unknown protein [Seminavis robusta]|eukprot:Sro419_g139010.1 n/a (119) ;mRNA; f:18243-18599